MIVLLPAPVGPQMPMDSPGLERQSCCCAGSFASGDIAKIDVYELDVPPFEFVSPTASGASIDSPAPRSMIS